MEATPRTHTRWNPEYTLQLSYWLFFSVVCTTLQYQLDFKFSILRHTQLIVVYLHNLNANFATATVTFNQNSLKFSGARKMQGKFPGNYPCSLASGQTWLPRPLWLFNTFGLATIIDLEALLHRLGEALVCEGNIRKIDINDINKHFWIYAGCGMHGNLLQTPLVNSIQTVRWFDYLEDFYPITDPS